MPDQQRVKPHEQSKFKARAKSFKYAMEGWKYVYQNETNIWIHTVVAILVIIMGIWLELSRIDWAILVVTFMAIMMAEFINTAIEAVVDMTMPEIHSLAKTAKDVAAGAVFLGAFGAIIVGLLILGPPLVEKIL